MNCTRVLHAFGSHPQQAVMPVDLAMCLSLSQRQPIYQLLSIAPPKPTQRRCQSADSLPRARLNSPHRSSSSFYSPSSALPFSPVPSEPRSCFRRDGGCLNKKRVVFADAKGLALTAVRLFIPEPSSPAPTLVMKPSPAKLQDQQLTTNKLQRYKLRLGFPQPTLDLKSFLTRLRDTQVQLESCNISEHSLSGKVCVTHVSIENAVHVRVTFDSWRSHRDIPCTFLQQQRCGASDMDVFAFDLRIPKNIDPQERIEFCVSFRPGAGTTTQWDDNRGQNYRVCMEKQGSHANQGDATRFCSTISKQQPPSWPSPASLSMQSSADQQYLQRSLSSRIRAEWKTLVSTK